MNKITIDSKIKVDRRKLPEYDQIFVKNEPMLFNCDYSHARTMGDILTNEFLSALPRDWKRDETVIDSRVHMLMPGWFPCIPGWHHDDVMRSREDKQPNYLNDTYRSEHVIALWGGDIAPTQFALGQASFLIPPIGKTIYEVWDNVVSKKVDSKELLSYSASDRELIFFDDRTWHRGTAAVGNGFRFFIRASRYFKNNELTTRQNKRTNELRKQSQVYMSAINAGW